MRNAQKCLEATVLLNNNNLIDSNETSQVINRINISINEHFEVIEKIGKQEYNIILKKNRK